MRVIVTGAIAWSDAAAILRELSKLPADTTIIHGDCEGVDALAGEIAARLGFRVERMAKCDQDFARHGPLAWKGLNERMLASGADLVLAFHPDLESSLGSGHLIELARAEAVEVRTFAG